MLKCHRLALHLATICLPSRNDKATSELSFATFPSLTLTSLRIIALELQLFSRQMNESLKGLARVF